MEIIFCGSVIVIHVELVTLLIGEEFDRLEVANFIMKLN